MTFTVAEPEVILPDLSGVEDLEAWLKGEIEKPCELTKFGIKCGHPASWLAVFDLVCCGRGGMHRFICDGCKALIESDGDLPPGAAFHTICGGHAKMTFIERIKE